MPLSQNKKNNAQDIEINTTKKIKFNRNEFAGAFGDIGTDLPLIVGVSLAAKLDGTSVLFMFGLMQLLTGFIYRIPMPVQPLKAMAAIVIAQKLNASILYGAGIAIGLIMAIFSLTGIINWLGKIIPKCVIRGVQFGLGLQLTTLALKDYIKSDGLYGYIVAFISFIIAIFLINNKKYPAATIVVAIGILYSLLINKIDFLFLVNSMGFQLPQFHMPNSSDIITGFVLLALPQIPLSLGNSIYATKQMADDLFPSNKLNVKKISLSYSIMNLINPFFGGVPTCHGSGGMAGHYIFGARTGGSVIIEGGLYVFIALFFGKSFEYFIKLFPLPILGVILFFEGIMIISLIKDSTAFDIDFFIILLVGLAAVSLPYGYLIGMTIGMIVYFLNKKDLIKISFSQESQPKANNADHAD